MRMLRSSVPISAVFASVLCFTSVSVAQEVASAFSRNPAVPHLVLGSIGDSISVAFNAANWGKNSALSWATGENPEINSIFSRLKVAQVAEVTAYNYAVAGSMARDLPDQVSKLMAKDPNFVTVLIGANDLCTWNVDHAAQLAAYAHDVKTAVVKMIEKKPDVKILLSAVPDIHRLYEVGREKGCSDRWRRFRFCKPLLAPELTDLDRQHFVERWHDTNNTLAGIAAQYADNVNFLDGVQNYRFTADDLSDMDCFHPSSIGQSTLAREAWNSLWPTLSWER